MIRAKFKVQHVEMQGDTEHVSLFAVNDPANKTWSQYTPGGNLDIFISNAAAQGQLKKDGCYFLDFTPAPAAEAAE